MQGACVPEDKAQTEAAGEIDKGRQREDRDKKSRVGRDKHSLETGEVHRDNADKQRRDTPRSFGRTQI